MEQAWASSVRCASTVTDGPGPGVGSAGEGLGALSVALRPVWSDESVTSCPVPQASVVDCGQCLVTLQ